MAFDWVALRRGVVASIVAVVREAVEASPDRRYYAAALDAVYAESQGIVGLPSLAMNSEEALAGLDASDADDVRWSPPDWEFWQDEWLRDGAAWEEALTAEACRTTPEHWHATFDRYRRTLARACRQARTELRRSGDVAKGFVVVVLLYDDDREGLLRGCLTESEMKRLFPEYDRRAQELARVADLDVAQQAAFFVARLGTFEGPVDGEDAEKGLRSLGPAAVDALVSSLPRPDLAWQAARLLADIGHPADAVVEALVDALTRYTGPAQGWAAMALSRLGRLDVVLARIADLPVEVVADAVWAPLSAIRDDAADPPPLDYRPLEAVLERYPQVAAELEKHQDPGHCSIRPSEVGEALRGLGSPHHIVRRHALRALGERRPGPAVRDEVLPRLAAAVEEDPVPDLRRLAVVALGFWKRDSLPYADAVTRALQDPDRAVRRAATIWLDEQRPKPS